MNSKKQQKKVKGLKRRILHNRLFCLLFLIFIFIYYCFPEFRCPSSASAPEFRCPSSASGARSPFRYALLRSRGLIYSSFILGHEASVITTLFRKGLTANFFKKSLIKNSVTFGFKSLAPKPFRRDQPAQRLRSRRLKFYDSFLYFSTIPSLMNVENCEACTSYKQMEA